MRANSKLFLIFLITADERKFSFIIKKSYHIEIVGTIGASQSLTLSVNAKMYNTGLTDAVSAFVQNEVQNIIISSQVNYETYVRKFKKNFLNQQTKKPKF